MELLKSDPKDLKLECDRIGQRIFEKEKDPEIRSLLNSHGQFLDVVSCINFIVKHSDEIYVTLI